MLGDVPGVPGADDPTHRCGIEVLWRHSIRARSNRHRAVTKGVTGQDYTGCWTALQGWFL